MRNISGKQKLRMKIKVMMKNKIKIDSFQQINLYGIMNLTVLNLC